MFIVHSAIHSVRVSPWFLWTVFLFPISCTLNSLLCSNYCDWAIANATRSIPPALLSYFPPDWALWPMTEPSTMISFIKASSASLSGKLRRILNILSWLHFNRLFFLNWDGQEVGAPELPFWSPGWAAEFTKARLDSSPHSSIFTLSFDISEFRGKSTQARNNFPLGQLKALKESNKLTVMDYMKENGFCSSVAMLCPQGTIFINTIMLLFKRFPSNLDSPLYQWQVALSK